MSEFLVLARDYIERMSNAVHGTATNEDYAIRFATLLRAEGFASRLHEEIAGLTDPTTLTSHGWLWLLDWAKSRNINVNPDLLGALYEEWSSVFVRVTIIELATRNAEYRDDRERIPAVEQFPHLFLATLMSRVVRTPPRDERDRRERSIERDADVPEPLVSPARAVSTLTALLQVGTPIAVGAARSLLWHRWQGRRHLLDSFWALCDSLDAETRQRWIETVHPPSRDEF